jgi:S1-C subfamily serine protease
MSATKDPPHDLGGASVGGAASVSASPPAAVVSGSGASPPIAEAERVPSERHLRSIVKIFVIECARCYHIPWQMEEQMECSGTGFAISGRRILTNAHVVAFATSIHLCRFGDARKFAARMRAVSHECDLALLEA